MEMKNILIWWLFYIRTSMVFAETANTNTKQTFLVMLQDIPNVNEQRMDFLNKLMNVQDLNPLRNEFQKLNNIDETTSEDEQRQAAIWMILDFLHKSDPNRPVRQNKYKDDTVTIFLPFNKIDPRTAKHTKAKDGEYDRSKDSDSNEAFKTGINKFKTHDKDMTKLAKTFIDFSFDDTDIESLRKSWLKSVKKKGAATCRKACKGAHKNFCRLYSCSKKARKTFKRECKLNCKAKFRENYYDE